jgi:hypothetical protein
MSFLRTTPLRSLFIARTLAIRTFTTTTRTMAPKQEWLVILPDQSGKLAERNQVRAYVIALKPPSWKSLLYGMAS